jgi:hypothetical protein
VSDPLSNYEDRLARYRAETVSLRATERAVSVGRIVFFIAAVLVAVLHFSGWIAIPIVAFVALIVAHDRLIRRRRRAEAAATFCARGIERVNGTWQGRGFDGSRFATEHHPFAADLDVFGKGSLYELLCIATTSAGRATLAHWLLHPGDTRTAEVHERQLAVRELRDRIDLREETFVSAAEIASEVEEARLDEWSREPALLGRGERMAAVVITAFALIAFAVGIPSLISRLVNATNPGAMPLYSPYASLPLIVMIVVVSIFARQMAERVSKVVSAVERREPFCSV